MEKWENRARKVEKRKSAMVMTGKGTLRQQNELREKARQAARAQARTVAYGVKAFGEVEA
jgi:hypothetical protein